MNRSGNWHWDPEPSFGPGWSFSQRPVLPQFPVWRNFGLCFLETWLADTAHPSSCDVAPEGSHPLCPVSLPCHSVPLKGYLGPLRPDVLCWDFPGGGREGLGLASSIPPQAQGENLLSQVGTWGRGPPDLGPRVASSAWWVGRGEGTSQSSPNLATPPPIPPSW